MNPASSLDAVWPESIAFGAGLFDELDQATRQSSGVVRAPYGEGEQRAHDIVAAAARKIGLVPTVDAAGNLLMTLEGADSAAPRLLTGSHLDSVPAGGNFDGAAGVVAGLVVVHALRASDTLPPSGVTVIATRAEEGSSWFGGGHKSHFGGRAALGQLGRDEMDRARMHETGKTLFEVMAEAGFAPEDVDLGRPLLKRTDYRGFVELHIEQGPVLVHEDLPMGIVTGIRGNLRLRDARVAGEDAHSGAVPRRYRRDALLAAVEFAAAIEDHWQGWLDDGRDAVCTFGRFGTDPARHSLTKVPGEVRFSLDIRSEDAGLLAEARATLETEADRIARSRGVAFELGSMDQSEPAPMTPELVERLAAHASVLGIPGRRIASGGGHDAANFSAAGWPTAMIFVRNPNGSHNPDEAMATEDFGKAARLLAELILDPVAP